MTPHVSDKYSSAYVSYTRGRDDGIDGCRRDLASTLNRLRENIRADEPVAPMSLHNVNYLEALDDVAKSHGLRKQTITTYVI